MENLVGYAKRDLMVPLAGRASVTAGGRVARRTPPPWRGARKSTPPCIRRSPPSPPQRLDEPSAALLAPLPSLRPSIGRRELRKVDKLSCVRFGSARYSVPNRLLGTRSRSLSTTAAVHDPASRRPVRSLAEHALVAPGEASVVDEHYGRPARRAPARKVTPENRCGEGVLRARAGRRAVAAQRRRRRATPALAPSWPSSPRCRPRTGPTR